MSHELLMREAKYQSTMRVFLSMLEKGIITQADYATAQDLMREKYHPGIDAQFRLPG